MTLKPCPCGRVPSKIVYTAVCARDSEDADGNFLDCWTLAGDCCGAWKVDLYLPEFCAIPEDYFDGAWNAAPRGEE